jgi:AcrR family transcriptional regulator
MKALTEGTPGEKLLAAARTLINDIGAEALTIRAVALAAGVTPGAIYRHFPSKEALLEQVVTNAFEKLQAGVWHALARHPPGSFERIAELGRIYIQFSRQYPDDYRLLFMPAEEPKRSASNTPIFQAVHIFEECIRDCIDSGVFIDADPRLIALLLWSRLHGLISLFLSFDLSSEYPELDRNRALEQVATATQPFILNGLRRR